MSTLFLALVLAATFRGDAARTGEGDGSTALNNRVAWTTAVGDRLVWPMSPVVTSDLVLVGTPDSRLVALSHGGEKLWEHPLGGPVAGAPTVADGTVYVADGTGALHALVAATGATLWDAPLGHARVVGSPAVDGDLVIWSGLDRVVRAVRRADGSPVWSAEMGGAAEGALAVADGMVVAAGADKVVHAWSEQDGTARWTATLGAPTRATPAIADGQVLIGGKDGILVALDLGTGAVRWRYTAGGFLDASPAVDGETVYVGSTLGSLHAVSSKTGERRWVYDAGSPILSSPTVSGGQVAVGTSGGVLHLVDAATGKAVAQVGLGAPVDSSPAVYDGQIFVTLGNGRVAAIGEPSYVAVAPAEQKTAALAVDAPLWIGRRMFLGGLEQIAAMGHDEAWVLGQKAGLFRSGDGGLSWSAVNSPDSAPILSVLPSADHHARLLTGGGVYEAADGLSWKRLGDTPLAWGDAPRQVSAGQGGRLLTQGEKPLLSKDGGLSWTVLQAPSPLTAVTFHPINPDLLLGSGADGHLYRSMDGGLSWQVQGDPGKGLVGLDVAPADPNLILGLTGDGGLMRSGDGGIHWDLVSAGSVGAGPVGLAWVPGSSKAVYAAWKDGSVLGSADGGLHWTRVSYGLPEDARIVDARFSVGAGGAVYVAVELESGVGGVYRLGSVAQHARLESVTFATGSAELTASASPVLDGLLGRLRADQALRLRAEGHTDSVGSDEDNLVLSVNRARAIATYMEAHGVDARRVVTFGYGEARPVAGNDTDAGRAENRRVELYLVRVP